MVRLQRTEKAVNAMEQKGFLGLFASEPRGNTDIYIIKETKHHLDSEKSCSGVESQHKYRQLRYPPEAENSRYMTPNKYKID